MRVARTDTFWMALFFWMFGLLFLPALLIGGQGNMVPELAVDVVGGLGLTWYLVAKVPVFQRMRYKMAQWGLGIAQLTLLAYLAVLPVYFVVCLFDRD